MSKRKRWGEVKVIKALLFTILLFVLTFALVALPVCFGETGAGILLGIIFLIVFIIMFCDI
jgi:hypothetical protein